MRKVLIIAPHIDDELIGCWSIIRNLSNDVTVSYLYELTEERKAEALGASAYLGYTVCFGLVPLERYTEIYVPSRKDWHNAHKQVNSKYRKYATHFYSVDMAQGKLLADSNAKKECLDLLYPSQRSLWQNNDKYWLFEDIQRTDYDVYVKVHIGTMTVKVLSEHATWVQTEWQAGTARQEIDALLSHCTGRVVIETLDFYLEA